VLLCFPKEKGNGFWVSAAELVQKIWEKLFQAVALSCSKRGKIFVFSAAELF